MKSLKNTKAEEKLSSLGQKKKAKPVVQKNASARSSPKSSRRSSTLGRKNSATPVQPKYFPIAGIGGSAGGLEAFKELLSNVPIDTGMAFVIIQHLDPTHESLGSEILARSTQMPVQEIKDGTRVEPDHVYVIPPNCNLGLSHGILKILPRTENRGRYLPFDFFLRALAEDKKTQAIGVVLSGTASDGTDGLRAIKAEGGIAIVQDPKTAKYDGMPRSAIASGIVDLIRSPRGIADELSRIARHPYVTTIRDEPVQEPPNSDESLARIFALLRNSCHVDFTHYKKNTLTRRISRRMLLQKTDDLLKYATYLEGNPAEVKALFANILIHVTNFFRDRPVFDVLRTRILPKYMKGRDRSLPFRIWVPGCSTGEEVYSLAMTFVEFQDEFYERSKILIPLSIFATDISETAVQKARTAVYPESISEEVSKDRLKRFFERVDGGGYRVVKWLRDCCVFSRHDVTNDPPFAKVDLISCRNVLIYFNSELQRIVFPIFHYALNPNGILLLGKSETIGGFANIFSLVDKANKIYLRKNTVAPLKMQFPVSRYTVERIESNRKMPEMVSGRIDFQRESDRIAATEFAPPSVIVNEALEILQTRGRTAPFLEFPSGNPSLNLMKVAHSELIADLRSAIQAARKKDGPVVKTGVSFRDGGKARVLTIKVVPIPTQTVSGEKYFAIFFVEITAPDHRTEGGRHKVHARKPDRELKPIAQKHQIELQKKLSANQEYLQSLIEEYEKSQEELVSSNEELQSTNEELQSTNEEMETAKEELQSANEELTTVNDEMQTRNFEMNSINNDLTNLLGSIDIPIVMVGSDGKIRRFTPKAGKALKLIPTDIGRPIGDIKPSVEAPDLDRLISDVIETMANKELETQDEEGHWYQLQVRPYRTTDNKIDGAVIALLDIDSHKRYAENLKKFADDLKSSRDDNASIIESQPIPLLVIDAAQRVKMANEIFYEQFQVLRTETEGKCVSELGSGQWKIPELQRLLDATLTQGTRFERFEVDHDFPRIGRRLMFLSSRKIRLSGSGEIAALLVIEDFTERKRTEQELRSSEGKYRNLVASSYDGIMVVRPDGTIEFANRRLEELFGYGVGELLNKQYNCLIASKDRQRHQVLHARYMANPTQREMGRGLDLVGRRKDGTEFAVDVSLSPFKSNAETLVNCVIRDISKFKEIEAERLRLMALETASRKEAERANQIKDEFLTTLSHELRTPLTTILGWAQELRAKKSATDADYEGLSVIERSALIQGQLIDDLLDVSRINAGKVSLTCKAIDLLEVLESAVESGRKLAGLKSIQVDYAPALDECFVFADSCRLQQVFWNILTNAIKFTPQAGKVSITLGIVDTPRGKFVQVQFIDTGMGIRPEFLPHIFERFSQVDSSMARIHGGLGLGLAIAKSLVEMQQGTISVASEGEGRGATFAVQFPLIEPDRINKVDRPREPKLTLAPRLDGVKVLVVDDSTDNRLLFSVILKSFGAVVRLAESVEQGLNVLNEFAPDIILSDISMPIEDGFSFISRIRLRDERASRCVPVVALTAYAGPEDVRRMLDAGFAAHIAKPVDRSTMASAIAKLLKIQQG